MPEPRSATTLFRVQMAMLKLVAQPRNFVFFCLFRLCGILMDTALWYHFLDVFEMDYNIPVLVTNLLEIRCGIQVCCGIH